MRAIELGWLWRRNKWLPLPDVVYNVSDDYAGCYYHPSHGAIELNDSEHDCSAGIIVVNPTYDYVADGILAHEWRHHWQFYNGWQYDGLPFTGDYLAYYKSSRSEADAFNFEFSITDASEYRHLLKIKDRKNTVYFN